MSKKKYTDAELTAMLGGPPTYETTASFKSNLREPTYPIEPNMPAVKPLPKLITKSELAEHYGINKRTAEKRLKAQGYETKMRKTDKGLVERGYQTWRDGFQEVIKGLGTPEERQYKRDMKDYEKKMKQYTKDMIEYETNLQREHYDSVSVSYKDLAGVFGYNNLDEIYDEDPELFWQILGLYPHGRTTANVTDIMNGLTGRYKKDFEVNIPNFL